MSSGLSIDNIEEVFKGIDVDCTGRIRYSEFLAAAIEVKDITKDQIMVAFDALDVDASGFITVGNLAERLAIGEDEISTILGEADVSGDGSISRDEFVRVMLAE